ncbi:MAG TPA: glycosyltransferase, partial [bacterium]|nr:glycosyltransferase [bacterium]
FYRQKKPNLFLGAGRLIKEKGFDDLIVFFSKICYRNGNARLNIAGDGPDRSRLERIAKDLGVDSRVFFLGHIPHNDLLNLMSESQFFALFSRYESDRLPNVLKEAMACGCLCIATDIPGNDELVIDNFTGILCPKADINLAVNKLDLLMHDPEVMYKIISNARDYVTRYFDVNMNMASYLNEWTRLKGVN